MGHRADILEELRQKLDEFQDISFPEDSLDEEISELHAQLIEMDGYVIGHLVSLLGGGNVKSSDLNLDRQLRQRLERCAASNRLGSSDAVSYLNYFSALEDLISLAKTICR